MMPSNPTDSSMDRLLAGVRKFRREIYPDRKAEYEQVIREGQKPHALFITCADSRIDPEALTQSGPGEIFVTRNIGNVVPAYGEMLGSTSAVIEYAVTALNVSHIVVCGHTDCGAMKGLIHLEKLENLPTVKQWLRNAEAARSIVKALNVSGDESATLDRLIEENVKLQMSHVRTHPSVAGRIAQGALSVSGWVYEIEHGTVRIYDDSERRFVPFDETSQPARYAEGTNG